MSLSLPIQFRKPGVAYWALNPHPRERFYTGTSKIFDYITNEFYGSVKLSN